MGWPLSSTAEALMGNGILQSFAWDLGRSWLVRAVRYWGHSAFGLGLWGIGVTAPWTLAFSTSTHGLLSRQVL